VALALGLGLRRGEICGLRWSDIDFQRGEMFVRNNKVQFRTEIEHDPKTKLSKRKLSLPKYLIDYLTKLPVISKYICILENQPIL
jgi:integrase